MYVNVYWPCDIPMYNQFPSVYLSTYSLICLTLMLLILSSIDSCYVFHIKFAAYCFLQIRTHIDQVTKCKFYYTPRGRFIHIPPRCPTTDWANDFGRPWWKDDSYCIGVLSEKTRSVRIINTLTSQQQTVEVLLFYKECTPFLVYTMPSYMYELARQSK